MQRMFMRRVGLALLLMLAATALTFWLVTGAPGNVAALIAERAAGAGADGEMIAKIADDLGLNDPLPLRYARWLGQDQRPYGKDASFAQACVACHTPVKDNDWVFTHPVNLP